MSKKLHNINSKTSPYLTIKSAKEPKFLIVDISIWDKLSPYALKVYGQLRKLVSYKDETDETEITIKSLAEKSGICIRKTYQVLNELEFEHFIIKRINHETYRHGKTNQFVVSQTYEFFKPVQNLHTPAQNDMGVQSLHTPALSAVMTAPHAQGTAQNDIPKEQKSFQKEYQEKHYKQESVSVFFDTQSVKTHIDMVIANRKVFVEEDIISQGIYYSFEKNEDKSFDSVNKRVNIFLKKVREGKWLIPQGWNGITSQSIRQHEEEYERNKQIEIMKNSQAARGLHHIILSGKGVEEFNAKVKTNPQGFSDEQIKKFRSERLENSYLTNK